MLLNIPCGSIVFAVFVVTLAATAALAVRAARARGLPLGDVLVLLAIAGSCALIGSRIAAIPFSEWLAALSTGGFPVLGGRSSLGGLVGLTLGLELGIRWTGLRRHAMDIAALPILVGLMGLRVGCFLCGCCFGSPTSLPWGVRYARGLDPYLLHVHQGLLAPGAMASLPVHPLPLYEIGFCALLALGLHLIRRPLHRWPGATYGLVVVFYAIYRAIVALTLAEGGGVGLAVSWTLAGTTTLLLLCLTTWQEWRETPSAFQSTRTSLSRWRVVELGVYLLTGYTAATWIDGIDALLIECAVLFGCAALLGTCLPARNLRTAPSPAWTLPSVALALFLGLEALCRPSFVDARDEDGVEAVDEERAFEVQDGQNAPALQAEDGQNEQALEPEDGQNAPALEPTDGQGASETEMPDPMEIGEVNESAANSQSEWRSYNEVRGNLGAGSFWYTICGTKHVQHYALPRVSYERTWATGEQTEVGVGADATGVVLVPEGSTLVWASPYVRGDSRWVGGTIGLHLPVFADGEIVAFDPEMVAPRLRLRVGPSDMIFAEARFNDFVPLGGSLFDDYLIGIGIHLGYEGGLPLGTYIRAGWGQTGVYVSPTIPLAKNRLRLNPMVMYKDPDAWYVGMTARWRFGEGEPARLLP